MRYVTEPHIKYGERKLVSLQPTLPSCCMTGITEKFLVNLGIKDMEDERKSAELPFIH